jgi:mono/diheme cytochrome c family protein
MLRPRVIVAVGVVALVAAGGRNPPAVRAQEAAQTRTVWDRVYSDAQAARGKVHYLRECSACHLAELTGSNQAVALAGEPFMVQWERRSVDDLLTSIRTTMPQGTPGQLSNQAYVDIVAFLLQANAFPAGAGELARDADLLKTIQIVRGMGGASPERGQAGEDQRGQAAFARACSSCHGADAKGQNGPALLPFEREFLEVRGIVRDGRGEMPSISPADVSDEELAQIVAYLKKSSRVPH